MLALPGVVCSTEETAKTRTWEKAPRLDTKREKCLQKGNLLPHILAVCISLFGKTKTSNQNPRRGEAEANVLFPYDYGRPPGPDAAVVAHNWTVS